MEIHMNKAQAESAYAVNFLRMQLSAPQARHLLISMVNNRKAFHQEEQFSAAIRNESEAPNHQQAIALLEKARQEVDFILEQALLDGKKVTVTGNLNITLSHDAGEEMV